MCVSSLLIRSPASVRSVLLSILTDPICIVLEGGREESGRGQSIFCPLFLSILQYSHI